MGKTVAFYTLGCKLNFSESSAIGRSLVEDGYNKVDFQNGADVYVSNSCSVTEKADNKCRNIVKEALKYSPSAFIAIIGCYAQLKPDEIAQIPGVDAVLGASEKFKIKELLGDFVKRDKVQVYSQDIKEANIFKSSHSVNDRTRTFLKVQDGCDYSCTFCTIPLARGESRSDSIRNIVASATEIGKQDIKEIVLTGVNIGDFGIVGGERKERFFDLVKELDKVEEINRFRISSIEPNLLSNEIIEFVAQSNRFVPHFHIPLQSGSDVILKLMRRRYKRDLYLDRVTLIKKLMPHACIGVDVIVGFPGETEEYFLETYKFLNELDVSYFHVFTYSERDDTAAVEMEGVVDMKDRNRRSKMLRILSDKKKRDFYTTQEGYKGRVLIENKEKDGSLTGFTENYVKVSLPYDPALVNELVPVLLKGITPEGVVSAIELAEVSL